MKLLQKLALTTIFIMGTTSTCFEPELLDPQSIQVRGFSELANQVRANKNLQNGLLATSLPFAMKATITGTFLGAAGLPVTALGAIATYAISRQMTKILVEKYQPTASFNA